jgi:excisionase family DNA binding protein
MSEGKEEDRLLSIEAAAKWLDVSYQTVWRMVHFRKVPAQRVGGQWRIKQSDLKSDIEPSGYRHKK